MTLVAEREEVAEETVVTATVILCAWRSLLAETAECMLQLRDRGWAYMIKRGDALITRSRSIAVTSWYLNSTDDVFLMIDDDVVFLPDDADRLVDLAREKRSIVCAAYPVKDGAHLACRRFPGQQINFGPGAEPVEIIYPATGFMACHRDVITAMIEARTPEGTPHFPLCGEGTQTPMWPFFDTFSLTGPDGRSEYLSEDYAFGEVARQLGFKVWLDPATILYHMGFYPYTISNMKDIVNHCAGCGADLDRNMIGTHAVDCEISTGEKIVRTSRGHTLVLDATDAVLTPAVAASGQWEELVAAAIERHLSPGDTFLDLGAHAGYFSVIAASKGANVIAVEANPKYEAMLRRNMAANGYEVESHAVGVSSSNGRGFLSPDARFRDHPGAAYLSAKSGIPVETRRLFDILGGRAVDFIKADIEGGEYDVFRDSEFVLRGARVIVFEAGPAMCARAGTTVDDLIALVESYGFEVTFVDGSALDDRILEMTGDQYTNLLAVRQS